MLFSILLIKVTAPSSGYCSRLGCNLRHSNATHLIYPLLSILLPPLHHIYPKLLPASVTNLDTLSIHRNTLIYVVRMCPLHLACGLQASHPYVSRWVLPQQWPLSVWYPWSIPSFLTLYVLPMAPIIFDYVPMFCSTLLCSHTVKHCTKVDHHCYLFHCLTLNVTHLLSSSTLVFCQFASFPIQLLCIMCSACSNSAISTVYEAFHKQTSMPPVVNCTPP